jgi:hypothetical protein
MAKNKPAKSLRGTPVTAESNAPAAPYPAVNSEFNPSGKTEPRDILSSKDGWSEYTLQDGTVMRVKAAILDVKVLIGQYSPDGDPIYLLQAAMVNQIKVPESLKRKK